MNVLVLGGGGREHALAWKIRLSPRCTSLYLHPGNAGTRREGFAALGELDTNDLTAVTAIAKEKGITLVVIGPEVFLAAGFGDRLREAGFLVVGPDRASARLETSKVFAKEFMTRAGLPTAAFRVAQSEAELVNHTGAGPWPAVLKLDGLAAGKGVVIAKAREDVTHFAERIWKQGEFGAGPHRVVVESFISGNELSYMGVCDGERFIPLSSATDFKRVGDGNSGPNTGGMGAISPSPFLNGTLEEKIRERITLPILAQLRRDDLPYRGVLYVGLMIDSAGDPHVLEFNARFGDPETQAVLLRLESDFVTVLEHTARGTLKDCPTLQWKDETAVYVVGAAQGYPEKVRTGDPISGLETVGDRVRVFFSGVKESHGELVTQGGRVLGVGATARGIDAARGAVYAAIRRIHWRGMHYRSDIGIVESK